MSDPSSNQSGPTDHSAAPSKPRSRAFIIAPLVIFLALCVMFGLALTSGDPSRVPSALIGKPVPQTDFAPLTGLAETAAAARGFTASELKTGQVTVVNFWASWCGPCLDEHPYLMALAARNDVRLFGINYKDSPSDGRQFLNRHGNPFDVVGVDPTGRKAIEWGVYGMPETFIVDGRGQIVHKHVGPISRQSLLGEIMPAIIQAVSAAQKPTGPPQS
ncbi:MAG: DsbE family thiol:disulfide interchange protein [Pseudomonadota bacterium]